MDRIRNSVKAIVRRDDQVLMIHCRDSSGDFYILPGGGQEHQETMADTLRRECREEIGCGVEVGSLRFVCEYIHHQKDFEWQRSMHQIEFMFDCALAPGEEPATGPSPDDIQVGVAWIPLSQLPSLRHYPDGLPEALRNPEGVPVYWGASR